MATVTPPPKTDWTVADLAARFGPDMPLSRIHQSPKPGTATVEDLVHLDEHEDLLCELIDGVLVEKAMGYLESQIAFRLGILLAAFVEEHKLGVTAGEAGMMQLAPGQVRIPDISYVSWASLEGSGFPEQAAPLMAPDLAVEVLSPSNTSREMERKLHDYFEAGVRLVWYVEPRAKQVTVYTTPDKSLVLAETDHLTGGEVLPGLEIELKELFMTPKAPRK